MAEEKPSGSKSDPKSDLLWVLGIFIVIGVMWFVSGGPQKNAGDKKSESFENQSIFGDNSSQGTVKNDGTIPSIQDEIKDIEKELERLKREVAEAQAKKEESPLKGSAFIDTAKASNIGPNNEYVRVRISSSVKDRILITGWELYSPMTGRGARIGNGVAIPKIGGSNVERPILASPGDTIFVSTGRSPIGISFRTNMCSGYLSQFQTFNPKLSRSCPRADEEASFLQTDKALSKNCLDFLRTIPTCQVYTKSYPTNIENECRIFVDSNMNYNACVNNHLGDTEFPDNDWYVYLNEDIDLWRNEVEAIKLLDSDGKTIDVDSYE